MVSTWEAYQTLLEEASMTQAASMTQSTRLAEEAGEASIIETCMGREGLMSIIGPLLQIIEIYI